MAIQLYESTLLSDDAPFDRFADGNQLALSERQQSGLDVFIGQGQCVNCHATAMFTKASTLHLIAEHQEEGLVERMLMGDQDRGPALYDNGFYNIAVRPTTDDPLRGGLGGFGNPLSFTRQYIDLLRGLNVPDPFQIDECTFEIRFDDLPPDLDVNGAVVGPSFGDAGDLDGDGVTDPFPAGFEFETVTCKPELAPDTIKPKNPADATFAGQDDTIRDFRTAVDGAAKVPTMRNIELTGPYFHNGGEASLLDVATFYNRRANFFNDNEVDVDPDINFLGLTEEQKEDLVAFLESVTDGRVRCEEAPFDHSQIFVPDGHPGDHTVVTPDPARPGQATNAFLEIPAVGAAGRGCGD